MVYQVKETMMLDPGTLLVNWLHEGCTFDTLKEYSTKNGKRMIEFQYLDYGKFSGKKDAMSIFTFERLRNEGKIEILK